MDTLKLVKDTNNNTNEIKNARGDKANLKERLDLVDSSLETKAKQVDLEVERNRITNLATLQQGSTTGDAELIDVRTGFDGKVYANSGESVRNQTKKSFDYARTLGKQLSFDVFDGVWKQGYIKESTGNIVSTTTNLSTNQYLSYTSAKYEISLNVQIAWICVFFYNGANPIPASKKEGSNIDCLQFEMPSGCDRFAISIGMSSAVTPSTMVSFYIYNRNNIEDLLVEELNVFDNKFVQGYVYESSGNITSESKNLTSSNYFYCKTDEKYKFKSDVSIAWFCVFYYNNTSKVPIGKYEQKNITNATFTIPTNITRFRFCIATSYDITPTSYPQISINYKSNKLSYLYSKIKNSFGMIDKKDLTMPFSIPMHIKTLYDKSTLPDGDWRKGHVGMGYDVVYNETDSKYYMAYSSYSGVETSIGMATSTDMINWTEYSNNPILPPTHIEGDLDKGGLTFPQFLRYDNKWIMYYVAYDEVGFEKGLHTICYAESTDLKNWTRKGKVVGLEIFTNNNVPMGVIYRPRVRNYFGRYYMFINAGEDDAAHNGASESIYVLVSDDPLKDWRYMGKAVDAEVIFANDDYKICSDPDVIYNGKEFIMTYWSYKGVHFMKSNNNEFPLKWTPIDDYLCSGLGRPVFVPTEKALYMLCNRAGAGATVSLQKADWS